MPQISKPALTLWAIRLTVVYMATLALSIAAIGYEWAFAEGVIRPEDDLDPDSSFFYYSQWAGWLMVLPVYLLNVAWIHSAHVEAISLAPEHNRQTLMKPLRSVAGMIIPPFSLFIPYLVMRQIWNLTLVPDGPVTGPAPRFFWLWWFSFVLAGVLAGVIWSNPFGTVITDHTDVFRPLLVYHVFELIAAGCFLHMIQAISDRLVTLKVNAETFS